jgi:predicted DNA binding protein
MSDVDLSVENAIRYISEELKLNSKAKRSDLINDASRKFDLTPMQAEILVNKYVLSGD